MRFIGVSDAHTDDVATLSGANVRRDVNSTMTASPANLKTKTSSPAERQVVDKIYQNIHHPIGDHGGNSMNIQYFCDGFWDPRILFSFLISQANIVRLDSSILMATSRGGDSRDSTKWNLKSKQIFSLISFGQLSSLN